jgi:hypothetical protein
LSSSFGDEVYIGTPSRRMLKQGVHRIVLRPLIKSSDRENRATLPGRGRLSHRH